MRKPKVKLREGAGKAGGLEQKQSPLGAQTQKETACGPESGGLRSRVLPRHCLNRRRNAGALLTCKH